MQVLIVEDEKSLVDIISKRLKDEGYIVDYSYDGEDGAYKANLNIYDLIILDVMLPFKNGFEILKEIRKNNIRSKVIMLTAASDLEDKLEGLESGANDYVTKPFHVEELVARVNVQLKRSNNVLVYNDLELDLLSSKLRCMKTKEEVVLVKKEFMLLEYFLENVNQVISKEQIYDRVWGLETEIESNNLEVYLSFIRKKLKALGSDVNIKAVRNMGYRME